MILERERKWLRDKRRKTKWWNDGTIRALVVYTLNFSQALKTFVRQTVQQKWERRPFWKYHMAIFCWYIFQIFQQFDEAETTTAKKKIVRSPPPNEIKLQSDQSPDLHASHIPYTFQHILSVSELSGRAKNTFGLSGFMLLALNQQRHRHNHQRGKNGVFSFQIDGKGF